MRKQMRKYVYMYTWPYMATATVECLPALSVASSRHLRSSDMRRSFCDEQAL